MSDFHNHKRVTARKDHKCEGCFEEIPQGTETNYCSGVWQGDFYAYRMCAPCLDYLRKYGDADEGFTPVEVGNWRRESSTEEEETE